MNLETLSDYAWKIMAFLPACAEGKAAASTVAAFGQVGVTDHVFIFAQLRECEARGLVQRKRDGVSGPWLWELTPAGRAALHRRRNELR